MSPRSSPARSDLRRSPALRRLSLSDRSRSNSPVHSVCSKTPQVHIQRLSQERIMRHTSLSCSPVAKCSPAVRKLSQGDGKNSPVDSPSGQNRSPQVTVDLSHDSNVSLTLPMFKSSPAARKLSTSGLSTNSTPQNTRSSPCLQSSAAASSSSRPNRSSANRSRKPGPRTLAKPDKLQRSLMDFFAPALSSLTSSPKGESTKREGMKMETSEQEVQFLPSNKTKTINLTEESVSSTANTTPQQNFPSLKRKSPEKCQTSCMSAANFPTGDNKLIGVDTTDKKVENDSKEASSSNQSSVVVRSEKLFDLGHGAKCVTRHTRRSHVTPGKPGSSSSESDDPSVSKYFGSKKAKVSSSTSQCAAETAVEKTENSIEMKSSEQPIVPKININTEQNKATKKVVSPRAVLTSSTKSSQQVALHAGKRKVVPREDESEPAIVKRRRVSRAWLVSLNFRF